MNEKAAQSPIITTGLNWYLSLDTQVKEKQAQIAEIQKQIEGGKGDPQILKAQKDSLANDVKRSRADQTAAEKQIKASGVDDWLGVNLEKNSFELLAEHFEKEGLELKSNHEEYLLETGFSNLTELGVALSRIAAGKEQNG